MRAIRKMLSTYCVPFVLVFLCVLPSCTTLQTFPHVARAGDTISVAVGSAVGMTKDAANSTAVYVSDSGGSYPVTIRSVFNLYPDKKSKLYQSNSQTINIITNAKHEAWQTVMVIDLPASLPLGAGAIQITSIADFPTVSSHINDVSIPLEILPGLGEVNTFDYEFGIGSSFTGDLTQLEALPHALIKPPINEEYYGAIEMRLSLPTNASRPLTDEDLRVEADDLTPSTVSNRNIIWSIANNELRIMLMSPKGWLQLIEARFAIVPLPRFSFTGSPVILDVQYYTVDGMAVSGPAPSEYAVTLY